jgi:hypothetical protein
LVPQTTAITDDHNLAAFGSVVVCRAGLPDRF